MFKKNLVRVKAANSMHGKNESGGVRMREVRFNEINWGETPAGCSASNLRGRTERFFCLVDFFVNFPP